MHCEMCQHMIEKSNPSGDLMVAQAIQLQLDINLCLICLTCYFSDSHIHSFLDVILSVAKNLALLVHILHLLESHNCYKALSALNSLSVSSGLPTLMRMWSRRPGLLKYRTRMPCSCA